MITAFDNNRIKSLRRLIDKGSERRREGLFTIEGLKLFREAKTEDIVTVYISESFDKRLNGDGKDGIPPKIKEKLSLINKEAVFSVKDQVFERISDTKTPQGIITVVRMPDVDISDISGHDAKPFIIALESIQDPGNLGTIIRSSEAAGVTGVIINSECADPYGPKAVRGSAGSIFRVPVYRSSDFANDIKLLKTKDIRVYAAHLKGREYYDDEDYNKGVLFLIGNEGKGLSKDISGLSDAYIRIPMEGRVESLNAGIAATLMMYEVHRQRRQDFD